MDSTDPISRRLVDLIAEVCALDASSLSSGTALDSIAFDSISLALTLRAIEMEFAIEFSDEDVADFLGAAYIGEYATILRRALDRGAHVV
jgi:acyl carrier protein